MIFKYLYKEDKEFRIIFIDANDWIESHEIWILYAASRTIEKKEIEFLSVTTENSSHSFDQSKNKVRIMIS